MSSGKTKEIPAGNIFDKYHTKNPVYRFLVNRFLETLEKIVSSLSDTESALEVGCGEGFLLNKINGYKHFSRLEGVDVSADVVKKAKILYPSLTFSIGSAYKLDYEDDEFDLTLALEVMEHLENYKAAISEIKRLTRRFAVISVPVEPLWRILNIARGSYLSSFGNTPGHMQHWWKKDFRKLMEKYFIVEKIYYPLPWQIALLKK